MEKPQNTTLTYQEIIDIIEEVEDSDERCKELDFNDYD